MDEKQQDIPRRYLLTLNSGIKQTTGYFDSLDDLNYWIDSGVALIVTATQEIPIRRNNLTLIQPIEEPKEKSD
jgi:hypothetical protein